LNFRGKDAIAWKVLDHLIDATWHKPTDCRVEGYKLSDLEFVRAHIRVAHCHFSAFVKTGLSNPCPVEGVLPDRESSKFTFTLARARRDCPKTDGVAILTLNRPERLNTLSTPIMEGLLEALPRLARDAAVGVIVLTGAGRAFCAGGDVKSMAEGSIERSMEEAVTHLRGRMEVSRLLHEIPKPTIAMVNGAAAGAGLSLALACDLLIAAQSARFVTATTTL
jgi:hypothetical protein